MGLREGEGKVRGSEGERGREKGSLEPNEHAGCVIVTVTLYQYIICTAGQAPCGVWAEGEQHHMCRDPRDRHLLHWTLEL